jgi:hypothetical protein
MIRVHRRPDVTRPIFGDNGSSNESQDGLIGELLAQNKIPNKIE